MKDIKFVARCSNCFHILVKADGEEVVYKCDLFNTKHPSSNIKDVNYSCGSWKIGANISGTKPKRTEKQDT